MNLKINYLLLVSNLIFGIFCVVGQQFQTVDLDVKTYRNGDSIFFAKTPQDWQQAIDKGIGAYCFTKESENRGILYNWFAVNDSRGLAPQGYKIPTVTDFENLIQQQLPLKSSFAFWETEVTEFSNFSAVPRGYRSYDGGDFYGDRLMAFYWTSTPSKKSLHSYAFLIQDESTNGQILEERRENGYAVKCIRNFNESVFPSFVYASNSEIKIGGSTVLSIRDGELAEDDQWLWFEGGCDSKTSIGSGSSITVSPTKETIYYLRTKKGKQPVTCISKTIRVNDGYKKPTHISGNDRVCSGGTVDLTVSNGELGVYTDWVWYENQQGNLYSIGKGKSITFKPTKNTVYSVRAETAAGNKTELISKEIQVLAPPNKPDKITLLSSAAACEGEYVSLQVSGNLVAGSEWTWFVNDRKVQTGGIFRQALYSDAEIKVLASNEVCTNSAFLSQSIKVYRKSKDPISIEVSDFSYRKKRLAIVGGELGDNAQWKWHKKTKTGNYKPISSASVIFVSSRKEADYKVMAVGGKCESTGSGKVQKIEYNKYSYTGWDEIYAKTQGIVHIGFELGGSIHAVGDSIQHPFFADSLIQYHATTFGLKGGFHFHPIMNEYFTVGARVTYGMAWGTVDDKDPFDPFFLPTSYSDTYSYKTRQLAYGSEALIGLFRKAIVKLIVDYEFGNIHSKLSILNSDSDTLLRNFRKTKRESLGIGFRFGSYGRKNELRGVNVDLIYSFNTRSSNNLFDFSQAIFRSDRQFVDGVYNGMKLRFWIHNKSRIEVDALFNTKRNTNKSQSIDLSRSLIQFSWVYSFDRFY